MLAFGFVTSFAFAEVPVVDYSTDANQAKPVVKSEPETTIAEPGQARSTVVKSEPSVSVSNLSADQRMNKLEQQINNINEQNLISKIDELQQRLQKLNGQLEDQAHQIEQLNSQLRNFYQDLNQRLEKPGVGKSKASEPAVETKASGAQNEINENVVPVATSEGEIVEALPDTAVTAAEKNDGDVKPRTDKAYLKEQQMYQTAIDLLPSKKYEASSSKLRDYLRLYPKGVYVANAHYWLGEINFLQKNYDAAEEEFKIVTTKYAKSKRVSDAMFKLALVHQNQGRDAQAKKELNQVVKRYPGTSAAQLAKLQLEGNG